MPILFDVFARLPGAKHERIGVLPAVPAVYAGVYDPVTGATLRPDLEALREALPYIHRKALDRRPSLWFTADSRVSAYGIVNTPSGPAYSACKHGSMSLKDRKGRWIRDIRFHAFYSGAVTHADGKLDNRYTYDRENGGHETPRYVTRFCGDFVAWSETLAGSHAHGWDHALARHAEMSK